MTPLLLAVALAASGPVAPPRPVPSGMARVGPGIYRPVYPPSPKEKEIHVGTFLMDALPVTNVQFLAFVEAHPRWQRGVIPALFADEKYMARWASPTNPGPGALPDQPVTDVSWFAAKACCESMPSVPSPPAP